jgi:dTDP-4-dehydrorhamnose reductase
MARIALIGANGQLGSDIVRLWPGSGLARQGHQLISLTHADIDVTDRSMVRSVLDGIQPAMVINTAAFHRVDDCEARAPAAFEVNGLGVKQVAEACRDLGAVMVHFSTDYVFDGEKESPYAEYDAANPISAYGITKLAGEHFLRYILPNDHVLVRSSGLYGVAGASGKGGNFVETVLRQARDGNVLRVVTDQVSTPTYTLDLAAALLQLLEREGRGTFHITSGGECSWYEFATEIFRLLEMSPDMRATTLAEFGSPAKRPRYSVLSNGRLREFGIDQPRPWQEAIREYLMLKGRLGQPVGAAT